MFEYNERGKLDGAAQLLTADVWLPRDRIDGANIHLVEQSAVIPELGAVFTMLWIPDHEVSHLDRRSPRARVEGPERVLLYEGDRFVFEEPSASRQKRTVAR